MLSCHHERTHPVPNIRACPLPDSALLKKYVVEGTYTDCYFVDFDHRVEQTDFICAFYTTWLFKLERWILGWAVKCPSSDKQAFELANALCGEFAAWHLEQRTQDQLLMCDFTGRTRSWLMTAPHANHRDCTRLYFGSAVVPRIDAATGERSFGLTYSALLGFHRLYSRLLLGAACSKLGRSANAS